MNNCCTLLLIEDNIAEAVFVQELLDGHYDVVIAETLSAARQKLIIVSPQAILLDLSLPDSFGLDTLRVLHSVSNSIPIVILTGLEDESLALQAMNSGAQDYIHKAELEAHILVRSIRYAVERKRAEQQIQRNAIQALQAEERLKLSLKASQTATWLWDFRNNKISWDEQLASMVGSGTNQLNGTMESFLECVHPEDKLRVQSTVEKSIACGGEYQDDYRVVCPDGSIRYISSRGMLIENPLDGSMQLAGVCCDITRQKNAEANNQRLALLEQREDFMATLTHDLKNPLINCNRILEIFFEQKFGPLTEKQSSMLRLIKDTNLSLLDLVQNMLEVYRCERDANRLIFRKIDLSELLSKILSAFVPLAQSHGIVVQGPDEGSCTVVVDRISIQRVVQNLLNNALKFTPPGGMISVALRSNQQEAIIEICDTGPGIPIEEQRRLFERFSQGSTGKRYAPGTGLGLYLCRQLIEAHEGGISCTNGDNGGAIFSVRLPLSGPVGTQLMAKAGDN